MMAHSVVLIRFFSALIFLSTQTLSQHNEFFYPGFIDSTNIILNESAEIERNGVLRLTNNSPNILGQAFYRFPFRFKNSTAANGGAVSFSTIFAFRIIAEDVQYGGHGLTFAVVASKELGARPQTFLGLFNENNNNGNSSNHIFAVEFDTIQNFGVKDINNNHVGIDVNSLISKVSAPAAYFDDDDGKVKNLTFKSGEVVKVWIDYNSTQNILNVTISPRSSKPRMPLLSYRVDLSSIFDEEMYIGFTASTGILASAEYILGWSFAINGQARDLDLSSLPTLPEPLMNQTGVKIGVIFSVSVTVGVFAISVFVFGVCLFRKHKKSDGIESWELQIGPHRYSYRELKQATRNFSEKEILGQGGFGKVYRGILPISKTQVAVKRISHDSKQGLREFVTEIATIGMLRHRNLVQFIGWCRSQQDLLLVYEFMANGSLDNYLFDNPKTILNWEQRFKVIKGVASALLYLHEGYEQVVIHRDVKASNVLLDAEFNGRLGDFGLAKVYEHGSDPNATRVVGTLGYMAPELARTGKSTTGSDVYAFGGLMLEVACGRRPVELKAAPEEMILVDWVVEKCREGKLLEVVDGKLDGEFDEIEMAMVLKLGIMCSDNEQKQRPSMKQVVRCLDGEIGVAVEWKAPGGGGTDGVPVGDLLVSFTSTSISGKDSSSSPLNYKPSS